MEKKPVSILIVLSFSGLMLLALKSSGLLMYWQQSRHWFLEVDPQQLPLSQDVNIREWNQLKRSWNELVLETQARLLLASRVMIEGKAAVIVTAISKPCPLVKPQEPQAQCPVVTKVETPKRKAVTAPPSSSEAASSVSSVATVNDVAEIKNANESSPVIDHIMQERQPIPVAAGEKILLIGDSMMQGVAPHLVSALQRKYGIEAVDMGTKSTGLTYPGFFNWPVKVDEAFANNQYKLLVVLLGANDTWDMLQNGRYIKFASPVWRENYNQRIEHIIQTAEAQGAKVIWLAPPPMGREDLVKRMPILNEILESALVKFPNTVRYVSTAETLTVDGKTFTKFLEVPEKGSVMVRKDDGVHFTPYGENLLAKLVLSQLKLTPLKPLAASANK